MLKEFKEFLLRGNLLDLAVAVVLGVAFGAVVASFVADVITPIIAAVMGEPNFDSLTLDIGDGVIRYGVFLNALLYFVIVALVMFFILKAAATAQRLRGAEPDEGPPPTDEAVLLAEIRDILRAQRGAS